MPSGVASAPRWKLSYMSAHAVGVFGLGADPPPESSEPSRLAVMSVPDTASRSACVIWPSFSSRLMRESRSATLTGTGWVGSLYGGVRQSPPPPLQTPGPPPHAGPARAAHLRDKNVPQRIHPHGQARA